MDSCNNALSFTRDLSDLAERLAAAGLVVQSLHCDWAHFGSWSVEVARGEAADTYGEALLRGDYDVPGPDVVCCAWDGREHVLVTNSAPTAPLCGPGPWTPSGERKFESGELALRFVENYLLRWKDEA